MTDCASYAYLPNRPEETPRNIMWTFTKTESSLTIYWNDLVVLNMVFTDVTSEACLKTWTNDVEQLQFYVLDSEVDYYRQKPQGKI